MSHFTLIDVRLTPQELEITEQIVQILQGTIPAMTIDDALDAIFRAGMNRLVDKTIDALSSRRPA